VKICFSCEYFPPFGSGGGEISTFYQAEGLANSGQKIVVVTPDYGATEYEERDNMKICRFPFFKKLKTGEQCNPIFLANPIFFLYFLYHLVKTCRREKVQIIHAHTNNAIISSFFTAKLLGIKSVVTLRDTTMLCAAGLLCLHEVDAVPPDCGVVKFVKCVWAFDKKYYPEWGLVYRLKSVLNAFLNELDLSLKRMAIRKADALITVSDGLKSLCEHSGINGKRMVAVYNSPPIQTEIDEQIKEEIANRYKIKGRKVILYAGKMSYGKGTDVLIESIEAVIKKEPCSLFVFLGKKNPLILFPERLKDYYVTPGFVSNKEAQVFFALADVVVVPSVWQEPLSRVLLEGMYFSKPIVATKVGGMSEAVINGKTGLLVGRGSPDELAKAIIAILKDRHRAEVMGREGKKLLEDRFSIDKNIAKLMEVYGNSTPD